jgi:hypothetical protein
VVQAGVFGLVGRVAGADLEQAEVVSFAEPGAPRNAARPGISSRTSKPRVLR